MKVQIKRVEALVDVFAHLITLNSEESFNKIWERYFSVYNIGTLNYYDTIDWLEELIEVDIDDDEITVDNLKNKY